MPTFFHLSDLHFGPRFAEHLDEVILKEIADLQPDAVVISGDFTYRARRDEYEIARDFVKRISRPLLTIPGNHDQPLYAPFERLTRPYARYCEYIHPTVDAVLSLDGLFVLGLSDCRPILPGGFWSREQRAWIDRQLAAAPSGAAKIIASHHQFLWGGRWRPAGFWYPTNALDWLARRGVELVLNGHTHVPTAERIENGIVVVRAGTAASTRYRAGWGNSYNLITIHPQEIVISIRQYEASLDAYVQVQDHSFPRRANLK